jgi:hypothetical protein
MVQIEQQDRGGVSFVEGVPGPALPAFREILADVGVFVEEAVVMGDSEFIEDSGDHVEVGDEDGLAEVLGKLFVAFREAGPELGAYLAERVLIELRDVEASLEALEELKGAELAEGDGAELAVEVLGAELQIDLRKGHCSLL